VQITVLIPTLNESNMIGRTLQQLQNLEPPVEVIVVDGFSCDSTREIALAHGAKVVLGSGGRGASLKLAASTVRGDVLWFLHADTLAPLDAATSIVEALKDPTVVGGNFRIKFDGKKWSARFLTWLYPYLRYLGLIYGDSGIFLRRESYDRVGGLRSYPVFEDVDLIRRLRRVGRFVRLSACVVTSSRRFEDRNFGLVFGRWLLLNLGYWVGIHPNTLGRWYPSERHARNLSLHSKQRKAK
jgi:rSAM/selenodomain-associated transferase 2